MRKLFIAVLLVVLTASFSYAEMSASTYSGKAYPEQQVFIDCYNNSGTDISSNYVVVLDTSTTNTASGSTLGTYVTTTTTANNNLVIGVTDQVISNGKAGRVCVRGPHKVYLTSAPSAAGASLATTTTAGAGAPITSSIGNGAFGVALHTGVIAPTLNGSGNYVGGFVAGEGTSNYWAWIRTNN